MFEYRVTWYNACKEKEEVIRGLVASNSYRSAVNKVVDDYGEEDITDLYLMALEDTNTIELETIKKQFNL